MNEYLQTVVTKIQGRFGVEMIEFRGDISLVIPADQIVEVVLKLRDEHTFKLLIDITAVDYWPQVDPRFHIIYHLVSLEHNVVLCLRVPVNNTSPDVPTVEDVFPGANWYEREVWDMFGVKFLGHSDMRRIIMPEDWEGHPLRKDYPLGYEEVQFTFNFDEISLRKPHPQD